MFDPTTPPESLDRVHTTISLNQEETDTDRKAKTMMEHPIHKLLHGFQIIVMNNLDEKQAREQIKIITGIMAYIDVLETNLANVKEDIANIIRDYGDDKKKSPAPNSFNNRYNADILVREEVERIKMYLINQIKKL